MNFFKTLYTNWRDLFTITFAIFALYFGLAFIEHASAPSFDAAGNPSGGAAFLFDISGTLKACTACALIVSLPWLFIAMTFPNTLGKFVNDRFEDAWSDYDIQTIQGRKLTAVLAVYLVLVVVCALVWNGVLS
jgi:hypothetical protein